MKNIYLTLLFLAFGVSLTAQNSSNAYLGVGRYDTQGHQNYSYKVGFEKRLNKVFSFGLTANYYQEDETFRVFKGDLPPFEDVKVESRFEGVSYELTLDAFLLGLDNNKFQTHLTIGGGAMHIPNYAFVGFGSAAVEERVQFASNYQLGIGYLLGFNFDSEEQVGQAYVIVRKLF